MDNELFLGNKYKNKTFAQVFVELHTNDWKYYKYIEKQVNDGKKDENLLNNFKIFIQYYQNKINSEQVEVTVLENSNNKIKYCYHISDIHIRLAKRYDEYQHVFDKLYKCLQEEDDGIIVITGDLLHSKCDLSGNCTLFTLKFLTTLASIFPTFLILGNHDMNLENLDDVDSITAIIEGRNIPNLYYLKNSGVYEYNNLALGVCSRIDNKKIYAKDISADKIKIGLYHGSIANCVNDIGYRLQGDKLVEDFAGYDYVMLGDVHTFQRPKSNIAYASSLIMQDFTETGPHGYLKWFLEEKKNEYIEIHNDFLHVNFEIKENKIFYNNALFTPAEFSKICDLPPYGCFRLMPYDSDYGIIKEFRDVIITKTKKVTFSNRPNISTKTCDLSISNLTKADMLPMLIEFIAKQKISNIDLNEIKEILGSIDLTKMNVKKEVSCHEWKILSLKFNNLFVFGENNIIDFERLPKHEVYGIYGNNSYGKSTVIDVLCTTLFDKPARLSAKEDIINKHSDKFSVEITFEIGKDVYTFKKWGKRKKNNKIEKHETLFLNTKNVSGVDRLKTDKTLEDLIGDRETFLESAVCKQYSDEEPFWEKTPLKQKEKIMKLMNLEVFEYIQEIIKEKYSEIKKRNNNLKSKIEDGNKFGYSDKIDNHKTSINYLTSKIVEEQNIYKSLENAINENLKKLRPIKKYTLDNISEIENKIKNLKADQSKMTSLQVELDSLRNAHFETLSNEDKIRKDYDNVMGQIVHLSAYLHQIDKHIPAIPEHVIDIEYNKVKKSYDYYKSETNKIPALDDNLVKLYDYKNNLLRQLKSTTIQNNEETYQLETLNKQLEIQQSKINEHNKNITSFNSEIYEKFLETKALIQICQKDIKKCYEIKEKLSKYEYNPNCAFCMKNQFIVDAKKTIQAIPTLEDTISKCEADYETYLPILKLKLLYDESRLLLPKVEKELLKTKNQIENVVNKIHNNKIEILITNVENEINSIQKEKKKIQSQFISLERQLKDIEDDKKVIENLITKEKIKLLKISPEYSKFKRYNEEKTIYENIKSRITNIEAKLKTKNDVENKIFILTKELETIKIDLENQEQNIEIQKEIDSLTIQKDNSFKNLEHINNKLTETKTQLVIYNEHLVQLQKDESIQCTTQHQEDVYLFLKNTLSTEGVKLHLLQYYLPQISSTVNTIASEFIDREINLCVEDNELVFKSIKKGSNHHVKLHGGMETFILDLSFKIAFSQLSQAPKCNMLIIDERLSVLDKEHIENVDDILNFLRSHFVHTFLIAHEQKLKDATSHNIYITQDSNKISKIVFS